MRLTILVCTLIAACLHTTASAQTTITGRIVDNNSNPVAQATISLKVKGNSVLSDASGRFSLPTTAIFVSRNQIDRNSSLHINGMTLLFTNSFPQLLTIELFDMNGKRVGNPFSQQFGNGSFSLPLDQMTTKKNAAGLYIARIRKGDRVYTLPLNPVGLFFHQTLTASENPYSRLAKKLAAADTLMVAKDGYIAVTRAIDADVTQDLGDIVIASEIDYDALINARVDSLLALMTTEEKINQTAEVLVDIISPQNLTDMMYGSVFNGGGCPFPSNTKETWVSNLDAMHEAALQTRLHIPVLYGIDAVHGLGTVEGATVFPHNIGMGCTGDTALVAKMANITARECRALGINLNFGPAISVVRDERWGRSYEGYGETPEINAMMAAAYVRGLQGYGDMTRPDAMAACAKHFIGDGGTTNGVNGGVTELTEATIRAVHLPPYAAAVAEKVASIMPSYNAWSRDGKTIRCTNDKASLTGMLKTGLNWNGFCLSDWDAITQVNSSGKYEGDNVSSSINAGIDMAMISKDFQAKDQEGQQVKVRNYLEALAAKVKDNTVSAARLDDAVRRILRIKFRLGLFENAKSNPTLLAEFGSAAHRAVARECVRKSLVLLKNEGNALPLKKTEKIVVVGPFADKLGAQCGGWTIAWQGDEDISGITGTTILAGLKEVGGTGNVTFDEKGNNLGDATKIILVMGEIPYAEGMGDHGYTGSTFAPCPGCDKYRNGKISIYLSDVPYYDVMDRCFASGKPVILVLISGRPMIINPELEKSAAFVAAWMPGSEGGGVADVLYGDVPFTGKLKHTWPNSFEQIPINTGTRYADEKQGNGGTPLFNYDFGLTY